ncbi:YrhK family protein [Jiella marina]|uniref:YrhK family protein n=1 Tax=Jiella sp. LLJ827 TaxID=2917712 RepID=UPI002100DEE2|nr:YrhK family protein [Jiella sp. LLJ827]MCQ0989840.1 YrhK family protein [Jiella sp. LLJ827]
MIQTLVRDYSWIHLGIGLFGNFCFVVGSVLFFKTFESLYTLAVWLFVAGSTGMFLGSLGELAKSLYERHEKREQGRSAGS